MAIDPDQAREIARRVKPWRYGRDHGRIGKIETQIAHQAISTQRDYTTPELVRLIYD
jgi:hypothetical protein